MKKKTTIRFATAIGSLALTAASANAATTFITDNSTGKTLASNESDAAVGLTNGTTNNGLDGDTDGDTTVLALSSDDGGGAITFNTVTVSSGAALFMDGDSMGHGNDKWGNLQNWTFSLDQTISFDDMTFKTINETITLRSTAWVGDADASGTGWSFTTDATYGTFSILGASGPGTYDITTAGVSDVAAGTDITFGYLGGAGGGEELSSFTITAAPVPEPSSTALLGLGGLALILRRRK